MGVRRSDDLAKLLLRLMLAGLLLFHGVDKVLHPATLDFIGGKLVATGLPDYLVYGLYVGEVLAPIMIIIGIMTRLSALIVMVNMAFAVFLMHGGDFLSVTKHGGWALELQGFYFFSALVLLLLGSGRYAYNPD